MKRKILSSIAIIAINFMNGSSVALANGCDDLIVVVHNGTTHELIITDGHKTDYHLPIPAGMDSLPMTAYNKGSHSSIFIDLSLGDYEDAFDILNHVLVTKYYGENGKTGGIAFQAENYRERPPRWKPDSVMGVFGTWALNNENYHILYDISLGNCQKGEPGKVIISVQERE